MPAAGRFYPRRWGARHQLPRSFPRSPGIIPAVFPAILPDHRTAAVLSRNAANIAGGPAGGPLHFGNFAARIGRGETSGAGSGEFPGREFCAEKSPGLGAGP